MVRNDAQFILIMTEKISASLALILDQENRQILLTRRNQPENLMKHGLWQLPGGSINTGESADDAVRRELTEELGWRDALIISEVVVEKEVEGLITNCVNYHLFLVLAQAGSVVDISKDNESNEARWFNVEEALSLPSLPLVMDALIAFNLNT